MRLEISFPAVLSAIIPISLRIAVATIVAIFVNCMIATSSANDGAYTMSGNQLIPINSDDIDVVREKLAIKHIPTSKILDGDEYKGHDIDVSVHYELFNKGDAQSVIVGFEALPSSGDVNPTPIDGKHPYMKDFTVTVNGKAIDYKVAIIPMNLYETESKKYQKHIEDPQHTQLSTPSYYIDGDLAHQTTLEHGYDYGMFVYYFDADFKKGKNIIEHSYRFESSSFIVSEYQFDYVLTAINRWGNGTVEDFEMSLDMGEMTSFNIHNSFFDTADEWQLQGKIKAYPTSYTTDNYPEIPSTTFAVHDGYITFKKRNFTPTDELFLDVPMPAYVTNTVFDAQVDNVPFIYTWIPTVDSDDISNKSSAFSKKILRNFPFARRGYVFKNKKIQAYYERQPWYIANKNYKADFTKLEKHEQEHMKSYSDD